jgi:YD repeat-containing protein
MPWGCLSGVAEPVLFPIDPNGNLATKTEGSDNWVYSWNAENQLTKVEKNGSEIARFAYDPLGRRVEKVAGGVTTNYTYDRRQILREARGASGTFKDPATMSRLRSRMVLVRERTITRTASAAS